MALAVVLTEQSRQLLSAVVMVLGFMGLPMCISLLVVAVYIRFVVDEELDLVNGMNTAVLPFFLAVTAVFKSHVYYLSCLVAKDGLIVIGTINFVCILLLLSAMARARPPSTREASLMLLFVAVVVALTSSLLVLIASIFVLVEMALLPDEFAAGLGQAMQSYMKDASTKMRLDILQIDYKCCGDKGYFDWFSVPWVPVEVLVVNMKELQSRDGGEPYINDDVPFSCCNPAAHRPCIHHHVNTPYLHYKYDPRTLHTLHKQGCRDALMDFFGHTLLRTIGFTLLFQAVVQICAVATSRLIQTSMLTAVKEGDVLGPALGYPFVPPSDKTTDSKKDEDEGVALLDETATTTSTEEDQSIYDELSVSDAGDSSTAPPVSPRSPSAEQRFRSVELAYANFEETLTTGRGSARAGADHVEPVHLAYSPDVSMNPSAPSVPLNVERSASSRFTWGSEPDAANPNLYEPGGQLYQPGAVPNMPLQPDEAYYNEAAARRRANSGEGPDELG